jgi:hypothetical protein
MRSRLLINKIKQVGEERSYLTTTSSLQIVWHALFEKGLRIEASFRKAVIKLSRLSLLYTV